MFKAGTSFDQRLAVAQLLEGPALWTLTQECARTGDLEGLRAIDQAGGFEFEFNGAKAIAQGKHKRSGMLSSFAAPMIDALAASLMATRETIVSYATPMAGEEGLLSGLQTDLVPRPELHHFVAAVFERALRRIDALSRDATVPLDKDEVSVKTSTLAVIAGFGCATDRTELVLEAQRLCTGPFGALGHMLSGEFVRSVARTERVTPGGLALTLGSLKATDCIDPATAVMPMGMENGHSGLDDLMFDRFVHGGWNGPARPEVLLKMIGKLTAPVETEDLATAQAYLIEHRCLPNLLGGCWSHVAEAVWDVTPTVMTTHPWASLRMAAEHGMQKMVGQLLSAWSSLDVPKSVSHLGFEMTVVPTGHPITVLTLLANHHNREQMDQVFCAIFTEMVHRGQGDPLLDPTLWVDVEPDTERAQRRELPLAQVLVLKGLTSSLLHLSEMGFDFDLKTKSGAALLSRAFYRDKSDGIDMESVLRSLAVRRQAMDALDEMASMTRTSHRTMGQS